MKISTLVFDLDDTLLDTTGLLIPIAKTPAFYERIKKPLPLMDGAIENLRYLYGRYILCLVTLGHLESQQQKIESMGIKDFFKKCYFADPLKKENKIKCFERLKADFINPGQNFLSIGNRRYMDIRNAKQIGGMTCLFRYGEHQNELPEIPEDNPDFEISHHQELIAKCRL